MSETAAMGLITKAGYDVPPYVMVGVPGLLALWVWRRTVRVGRGVPTVAVPAVRAVAATHGVDAL
jgi:hypothetical protein